MANPSPKKEAEEKRPLWADTPPTVKRQEFCGVGGAWPGAIAVAVALALLVGAVVITNA